MLEEYIKVCLPNRIKSMNNEPQIFNLGFCNMPLSVTTLFMLINIMNLDLSNKSL